MHPILAIDNTYDLLSFIKKSDRQVLFADPVMQDVAFLSRVYEDDFQPIAHSLAGLYRFQLGAAQQPDVLSIKNQDGQPLGYVLMSARCGGYSRQVSEINAIDRTAQDVQARLVTPQLRMLNTIGADFPELFRSIWPLTDAVNLPVVKRHFKCISPDHGPAHDHHNEQREYERQNPLTLTAFDALSASDNYLPSAKIKMLLWFHNNPDLLGYVRQRIEQNPINNPALDYRRILASDSCYADSQVLLLLSEHYQKAEGVSPFVGDDPRFASLRHLVQRDMSGNQFIDDAGAHAKRMQQFIAGLPPHEQEAATQRCCETLLVLKDAAAAFGGNYNLEKALSAALLTVQSPVSQPNIAQNSVAVAHTPKISR